MTSLLVVMGVSGTGKTTVGRLLAERLGLPFVEGDDFHDPENVARMRAGQPLDDAARGPWLDRLNGVLRYAGAHGGVVVACSALTAAYRRRLTVGAKGVRFVFLHADEQVLRRRIEARRGHYAGVALLPSQLATLEPPSRDEAVAVDVSGRVDEVVDHAVRAVRDTGAAPA
ncbi:MAG TPA: gluconokinase [Acidimicrobiia bacterium]|jgi:gluconokinase